MGVTDLFRVQELKDNLAAKQKEADELRRKVAELSESLNQASQQKKHLLQEVSRQAKECADLTLALKKSEMERKKLQERSDSQSSEISALQSSVASLQQDKAFYENAFTDEHGQIIAAKEHIAILKNEESRLEHDILQRQKEIEKLAGKGAELREAVIELEDEKLMQEFGLYKPMYDFASSEEYKAELQNCRENQKRMIRLGVAANCSTQWKVNGSLSQGRKMIEDNIKSALLSFNTECENAIDKVKFNNFDSMKKRIDQIYKKINGINAVNAIQISFEFLELKHKELALAYEYARKKQEEKERAREQREIERENLKVQKEIEEERRRIEKEHIHYENLMQRLNEQMESESNDERKKLIQEKIEAVNGEISDLEKALKDVDYRAANERAGYVYVISNIGAFGEGVYKIGMTRRLEPKDRIDELGGASVPFRFDIHALIFSDDAPKLETALHNAFADKRVNMVNGRKEFFHVSLKEIEQVVRENYDKTVDFKYLPDAEQYRESMKMRGT